MSEKLINLNPDLKRLRDEGYELEINNGFLILHSVPYVTSSREISFGTLVSSLELAGDKIRKPSDHQVWFSGEHPCQCDGRILSGLGDSAAAQIVLSPGVQVNYRFSNRPPEGYADYYDKMTRYVDILSHQARAIDTSVTAKTFKPVQSKEGNGVFHYFDTASSRAGLSNLSLKCAMRKIAIVGLGGTGSYVLDLIAKTHVAEIHLYDGDKFCSHNAFRAPGAASLEVLQNTPSKVEYFASIYSHMRTGLIPHVFFIDDDSLAELDDCDFVFLCVDKPSVRRLISDYLMKHQIPFIDVGMELEYIEEDQSVIGVCRVTMSTEKKSDHFRKHVSLDESSTDDIYDSNIQIAEMNALNASLAVIKWKKHCTFYQDQFAEFQSVYSLNTHHLSRDETEE